MACIPWWNINVFLRNNAQIGVEYWVPISSPCIPRFYWFLWFVLPCLTAFSSQDLGSPLLEECATQWTLIVCVDFMCFKLPIPVCLWDVNLAWSTFFLCGRARLIPMGYLRLYIFFCFITYYIQNTISTQFHDYFPMILWLLSLCFIFRPFSAFEILTLVLRVDVKKDGCNIYSDQNAPLKVDHLNYQYVKIGNYQLTVIPIGFVAVVVILIKYVCLNIS